MEWKSYQTKERKAFESAGLDLSKSVAVNCDIHMDIFNSLRYESSIEHET